MSQPANKSSGSSPDRSRLHVGPEEPGLPLGDTSEVDYEEDEYEESFEEMSQSASMSPAIHAVPAAASHVMRNVDVELCPSVEDSHAKADARPVGFQSALSAEDERTRSESESSDEPYVPSFGNRIPKPRGNSLVNKNLIPSTLSPDPRDEEAEPLMGPATVAAPFVHNIGYVPSSKYQTNKHPRFTDFHKISSPADPFVIIGQNRAAAGSPEDLVEETSELGEEDEPRAQSLSADLVEPSLEHGQTDDLADRIESDGQEELDGHESQEQRGLSLEDPLIGKEDVRGSEFMLGTTLEDSPVPHEGRLPSDEDEPVSPINENLPHETLDLLETENTDTTLVQKSDEEVSEFKLLRKASKEKEAANVLGVDAASGFSPLALASEPPVETITDIGTAANLRLGESGDYYEEFEDDFENDIEEDDDKSRNGSSERDATALSDDTNLADGAAGAAAPASVEEGSSDRDGPLQTRVDKDLDAIEPSMWQIRASSAQMSPNVSVSSAVGAVSQHPEPKPDDEFKFSRRFLEKKRLFEEQKGHESQGAGGTRSSAKSADARPRSEGIKKTSRPRKPSVPKFPRRPAHKARKGSSLESNEKPSDESSQKEALRLKLIRDIEEAKKHYLKKCRENGISCADLGALGVNADVLAPSPSVSQPPQKLVPRPPPKQESSSRPPWGLHRPRLVHAAGGQVPLEPSRSLGISTFHSSPIKHPALSQEEVVASAYVASVAFKHDENQNRNTEDTVDNLNSPIHKNAKYNGMGEMLSHDSPRRRGGWPSPRYNADGAPKPGHGLGNRFIVAPSTFLKAPREDKQLLDFYAAPIKFPIFRPLPVKAHQEDTGRDSMSNYETSVSFSHQKGPKDTSLLSPTSLKAKLAAAVAQATAAALNGDESSIDIAAMSRPGEEPKPSPESKLVMREAQAVRMKELIDIMSSHLETVHDESSRGSIQKKPQPIEPAPPKTPPKKLSRKEQKELEVKERLEKLAKQDLTEKQYEERQKRKKEEMEKRLYFQECLEAKRKVDRENDRKARAARRRRKNEKAPPIESSAQASPEELSNDIAIEAVEVGNVPTDRLVLQTAADHNSTITFQTIQPTPVRERHHGDQNYLAAAIEAAKHAAFNQEDLQLIERRGQLGVKYDQTPHVQDDENNQPRSGAERESWPTQNDEDVSVDSAYEESLQEHVPQTYDDSRGREVTRESTGQQTTIIMMTKLSPPHERAYLKKMASDDDSPHLRLPLGDEEEAVQEEGDLPPSPRRNNHAINFVSIPHKPKENDTRDRRSRSVEAPNMHHGPPGANEVSDAVGKKQMRVKKMLPKASGPAQRKVSVSSAISAPVEADNWIIQAIKEFKPTAPSSQLAEEGPNLLGAGGKANGHELPHIVSKSHGHHKVEIASEHVDNNVNNTKDAEVANSGPKLYNRFKYVVSATGGSSQAAAAPPEGPPPSYLRSRQSGGHSSSEGRAESAINMDDFYAQISISATRVQEKPVQSSSLPTATAQPTVAAKPLNSPQRRSDEDVEYEKYYNDIFEEFQRSL